MRRLICLSLWELWVQWWQIWKQSSTWRVACALLRTSRRFQVHMLLATSNPKSPGDNRKSLHQTKKQENLHSHENRQVSLPLVLTVSKCCFRSQASCLSRAWTPPQLFSAYCRAGSVLQVVPKSGVLRAVPGWIPAMTSKPAGSWSVSRYFMMILYTLSGMHTIEKEPVPFPNIVFSLICREMSSMDIKGTTWGSPSPSWT